MSSRNSRNKKICVLIVQRQAKIKDSHEDNSDTPPKKNDLNQLTIKKSKENFHIAAM